VDEGRGGSEAVATLDWLRLKDVDPGGFSQGVFSRLKLPIKKLLCVSKVEKYRNINVHFLELKLMSSNCFV